MEFLINLDRAVFTAVNYDLGATMSSGQAFRWRRRDGVWTGVVGGRWVRLRPGPGQIEAQTAAPEGDWQWLRHYLQLDVNLTEVLAAFPQEDVALQEAVRACAGLRLLRQEPWECLASFILSSTKQIVQIQQIVALLCERFGEPVAELNAATQKTHRNAGLENSRRNSAPIASLRSFPSAVRIAGLNETDLRNCKMGFRAPNLLNAARQVADGKLDLVKIRTLDYAAARAELMTLRGVGGKIADCVLLFAFGFDSAFPVDVWIERALQELYFPRRRASEKKMRQFAATHFGPHAGYAQQYLFHYMRTKLK
jgi:N-glycosylase/DNA lyase